MIILSSNLQCPEGRNDSDQWGLLIYPLNNRTTNPEPFSFFSMPINQKLDIF
jgi:hypothetical protein